MSSCHPKNFPPLEDIFKQNEAIKEAKSEKDLSPITKAELFGGFAPTVEEIAESSIRSNNPFDEKPEKSSKTGRKISKSTSSPICSDSLREMAKDNDSAINSIANFIKAETARFESIDEDFFGGKEILREVYALSCAPNCQIRRKLFRMGLI